MLTACKIDQDQNTGNSEAENENHKICPCGIFFIFGVVRGFFCKDTKWLSNWGF